MFYVLLPLIVSLALVENSDSQQFRGCDYAQQILPSKRYYIYNEEYPQNYRAGASCRWIVTSETPIQVSCNPFDIPPSSQCSQDALIIKESGDVSGHRYCGRGNLTFVSRTNNLTIILSSVYNSPGGKFLCTVQAQSSGEGNQNCRCGWKNPTRIVGGEETGVNEFPMMAALIDITENILLCGATIINEKQVLTAAHCLINGIASVAVLVGDHDLTTGKDTNASKLHLTESFAIHPAYNSTTSINDIGLVTVRDTIKFGQLVGPACLPFQHAPDTFAGSYVTILGWGSTNFAKGPSNTLQKALVSVITNARCRLTYPRITPRQMCTQEPGKDSCQFDSGGPLLWQNPSTRRIVEVGIISLGSYCADGEPAENTRVGAFMNWIVSNTPSGIKYCTLE